MKLIIHEVKKILTRNFLIITLLLLLVNYVYLDTLLVNRSPYRAFKHDFENLVLNEVMDTLDNANIDEDLKIYFQQEMGNQISYSVEYSEKVDKMVQQSEVIKVQNKFDAKAQYLSNFIIKSYQHRSISRFTYPFAIFSYLINDFSSLLLLFITGFISASIYNLEKETGVLRLQIPTINNRKVVLSKSLALLFSIVIITLVFTVFDLLMFNHRLAIGDMSHPLFSIPEYAGTPLNITIWGFILLRVVFIIIGLWFFGLLFSLISIVINHSLFSLVLNLFIILGCESLSIIPNAHLFPYSLFSVSKKFNSLNYVILLNRVILTPWITIIITLALILLLIWITNHIYLKQRTSL